MRIAKCFCCLLLVSVIGCNQGSSLQTSPVSGLVTLDGQPVDGATVTFMPKGGTGTGYTATGLTNAEGRYELQTFESAAKPLKGAVPGDYDVVISKVQEGPRLMAPTEGGAGMSAEQMQAMSGGGDPSKQQGGAMPAAAQAKSTLPAKYASPKDSGLSATVTSGQNPSIDFKLTE